MNDIMKKMLRLQLPFASFEAIMVYGSSAYKEMELINDIDIICITEGLVESRTCERYNGIPASVNVVGADWFDLRKAVESGFYHSSKLLSPLLVLHGDPSFINDLTARSVASFAETILPLLPNLKEFASDPLSVSASLYSAKCNINYEYVFYLVKWHENGVLQALIKRTAEFVSCIHSLSLNNLHIDAVASQCALECLKAKYWSTYYRVHEYNQDAIACYFDKFIKPFMNVAYGAKIQALLNVFEAEYGIPERAFPKYSLIRR